MALLAEVSAYTVSVFSMFPIELALFLAALCVHMLWNHMQRWSVEAVGKGKAHASAPLNFISEVSFSKGEHQMRAASCESPQQRSSGTRKEAPHKIKCKDDIMAAIRKCAARKDPDGAKLLLDRYAATGGEVSRSMCHAVLAACAAAQSLDYMETIVDRMRETGIIDIGSCNILIKSHLAQDHYDRAKSLLDEMRKDGPAPNIVTYNEMIAGFARSKYPPRKRYVWRIIEQMRMERVEPNCFTCSIILKNVHDSSPRIEVARVMELTESLTCEMDEVLMSSIVEANVRLGKPELVRKHLQELHVGKGIKPTTCATFGSLIKGYGYVNDTTGVWRCWRDLRSEGVRLSGITISCMVEAVASNGDVDGAHGLIVELLADDATRGLIDPWIYGLVLKGYGKTKNMERLWAVYEEMLAKNIQPTTVTFNLLIDACTRNMQHDRVPRLVEDMPAKGCEPNLITYSTLIKGYCQVGDMQAALALLRELRRHRRLKPDEVIYKTLIECCATRGYIEEAQRLFREMQAEGIAITSYILTRMVRLLGQKGDVDGAFKLSADTSQQYRFCPNSHVCNALIETCLSNGQPKRATTLCIQMAKDHIDMDADLCQRLVTALIDCDAAKQAVGLLSTLMKPPRPAVPTASPVVLDKWRSMFTYNCPVADPDFLAGVFWKLLNDCQEDGLSLAKALVGAMQVHRPDLEIPAVADHLKE